MTYAPQVVAAPPRRWRRRLLILGCLVLALSPLLFLAGLLFYQRHRADQNVEEALAATDAQDPQWRLADIEKRRTAVPDAENAARPIQGAIKLLPANWPSQTVFDSIDLLPPYQLDPATLESLRAEMKLVQPALVEARRAMKLGKGWLPIKWSPEYVNTNLDLTQRVRSIGTLLQLDAALRSQDGDHAGAWQSSLNQLALCRAIGEEPTLVSQLVRMAIRHLTVMGLERTLAQGAVDDAALAEAQKLLQAEVDEPILLFGLRGDRANLDILFINLEKGTVDLDKVLGDMRVGHHEKIQFWLAGGTFEHARAYALNRYLQVIDIVKGPAWEQQSKLKALDQHTEDMPPLARLLTPALTKIGEAYLRSKARLECAIAAIGVERYRLQFKKWPDSLDQVVAAKLLDKVPTDVYDGKALRYRKFDKGVVVYSVGLDGNYRGDVLDGDANVEADRIRYEFRLWEVEHRRQPARPRPKDPDGPGGDEPKN
jgi:hypothetical protein